MQESARTALRRAAISTFEQVAFLLLEPDDSMIIDTVDAERVVEFSGPPDGYLALRVGGGILPGIAGNMLGYGEAPSRETQLDALGELANMICGSVAPLLGTSDTLFRLRLRPLSVPDSATVSAGDAARRLAVERFRAAGGFVECEMAITPAAP
jgi:hypothetical protein